MVSYIIFLFRVGKKINECMIVDPVKYCSDYLSVKRYA